MMNRNVMSRQMFAKGGDVTGDGQYTQKDKLVNLGILTPEGDYVKKARVGGVQTEPTAADMLMQMIRDPDLKDPNAIDMFIASNLEALLKSESRFARNAARNYMNREQATRAPLGGIGEDAPGVVRGPDGRVTDYFPPEYRREGDSAGTGIPLDMPDQPSEQEMNDFYNSLRRSEELEQGEEMLFRSPAPVAPPEGVYMQTGGEPMAAAMEQGAVPAAPMAAMGAPSPADLGSMDAAGIASQMDPEVVAIMQGAANNFSDPEKAESLEGMMDAVRGTRATEEERREELAGVVGPEDAAATPDSVLAMVQPLMLMMSAQGAETEVDTGGIGPMAQDTMNVPVSGDMAGGIMQMAAGPPPEGGVPPVNFSQGGEVLRFNKGKAVPGYDVSPSYQPTKNAPLSPVPFTPYQRMIDNPAPAPAAKSSSIPDFGPTAAARLQQYKALMGDTGAEEDKDLAQAQFFQDLAKFGFSLMQAPKVGENPLAQAGRAALETGLGQNTLNLMAKQKAAQRAADRGLKLASITTTEAELTAAFGTEQDANGDEINVAYNKNNPAEKVILGTKKSPAPQIKQIGRDFVQFTPTQDGTGFTAKKVYTAKAEEQLFTLGNTRYSYDPNTKRVTDLQTGKADPVLKVVNNRLVRVQDPNNPDSEAEVLVDLSDKKEKMKNFIFGSQAQADKFGLGTRNALVTTDTSGNIFIVGKDGQRKNIALIPDAMKGSFLPGSQAPEEYVAKLEQRVRDKKITERINPNTGVISFSDQGTNAFNLAPGVATLQDFRIESRNGVKTMVPVNVREGFFGDTGAKSIAEAAEDGLGFWSTVKAFVSNAASPFGDTFLTSAEVQRSKNAFRRLVILARDAFVNNPRMPVAELERVAEIFPNPNTLFSSRTVEVDKLIDLRSTLLQAQERNMTILTSPDAESAEKDIARRNVFKVSRVLSMMTGLDTKATNNQVQQGQEVLQKSKPILKQGKKK
jgi:hypothetical protein